MVAAYNQSFVDAFIAAQYERPHIHACALSIDSRASVNSLRALWPIRMCYFDLGDLRHGWGLLVEQTGS